MAREDTNRANDTPRVVRALCRAILPLYRFEINRRNRAFDRLRGVTRLDIPVISVGNLSVGGTGKTPMVAEIISWLREGGHDPCIAMRGYKSAGGICDEASAYARAFEGLPIVAQPDRLAGLADLLVSERGGRIDCVVLDDGFQHRKIARDLDIVLVDATRSPFENSLLPAGRLREPVASLGRAGAVVVTHAEQVDGAQLDELCSALIQELGEAKPVAIARHSWAMLDVLEDGIEQERAVDWLRGRQVMALCAIGNPRAFADAVGRATGRDAKDPIEIFLPDHDPFSEKTIARVLDLGARAGVEAIVTTDKDWSKLRHIPGERWPCPVVRPRLEMGFDSDEAGLRRAVVEIAGGAS